jgi:NAD(P)-dependent dehydrogenase (short-subunit alcohol dehydrogenase family)
MVEGRVCIVTGAGRGIGREHALALAFHGAKVVVNDVGAAVDGSAHDAGPAQQVVDEIKAMGGEAVANTEDISTWVGAQTIVNQAIETYGDLHVVVNNAGILRDRVLVNMTEDDWDSVMRVHLKGTFATSRWAATYWREQTKAGKTNDARIINTTSGSGLYGNVGQSNYGAAKAGIASFSIIAGMELERYGVTVNCLSPVAATRMTAGQAVVGASEEEQAEIDPVWIAGTCVWLASTQSAGITGRVFSVSGRAFAVDQGWTRGERVPPEGDPTKLDVLWRDRLAKAQPNWLVGGKNPLDPQ